jgi:hypothetical protein
MLLLLNQEIVNGYKILENNNINATPVLPNLGCISVKMEEKLP